MPELQKLAIIVLICQQKQKPMISLVSVIEQIKGLSLQEKLELSYEELMAVILQLKCLCLLQFTDSKKVETYQRVTEIKIRFDPEDLVFVSQNDPLFIKYKSLVWIEGEEKLRYKTWLAKKALFYYFNFIGI